MLSNAKQIKQLNKDYQDITKQLDKFINKSATLAKKIQPIYCKNTLDHYYYGLTRRISNIKHCILNISELSPVSRNKELPHKKQKLLTIILHAFLMNISGSLDNLAWIFTFANELDKTIHKNDVNLFNKKFKKHLSAKTKTEINKFTPWFNNLTAFRDPTAHRIPPYIPPYLEIQQKKGFIKIKDYTPCYTSSFIEKDTFNFIQLHPQTIADTRSVLAIADIIINETFKDIL